MGPDVGVAILGKMTAIYTPTEVINVAETMYDMIFPVPQSSCKMEEYVKENGEFDYGKDLA